MYKNVQKLIAFDSNKWETTKCPFFVHLHIEMKVNFLALHASTWINLTCGQQKEFVEYKHYNTIYMQYKTM